MLDRLRVDSPDTLSDQRITLALSPFMRQRASTADVSTRIVCKAAGQRR